MFYAKTEQTLGGCNESCSHADQGEDRGEEEQEESKDRTFFIRREGETK